jgi:radical SAM superfamily enzyme YgiQ (UPF0313 family)
MTKTYNKIAIVNFRAVVGRFLPSVRYLPTYEMLMATAMRSKGLAKEVTIYTLYVDENPETYYDEWQDADLIFFWEFFNTKAPRYVGKYFELAPKFRHDLKKPVYFGGFWPTSYGKDFKEFNVFDKIVQGFSIDGTVQALAENNDNKILTANGPSNFNKYPLDTSCLRDPSKYMDGNTLHGYITSFGCPGNCFFCANNVMRNTGAYFSPRSLEQVKTDLDTLAECFNYKDIVIKDLNFFYDKKRANGILEYLAQNNTKCNINLGITIKDIDAELLESISLFDETKQLYFGLESFDPKIRERLGKPYSHETMITAIEVAESHGYDMTGNIMLGFPFQTKEFVYGEVRTAVDLMETHKGLFIAMNAYKPEYGSDIQKEHFQNIHLKMTMHDMIQLYLNDVGKFQETLYGGAFQEINIEHIHNAMRLYEAIKRVRNYAIPPIVFIMKYLLAYLSRQLRNNCTFDPVTRFCLKRSRTEKLISKGLFSCMRFSRFVRKHLPAKGPE